MLLSRLPVDCLRDVGGSDLLYLCTSSSAVNASMAAPPAMPDEMGIATYTPGLWLFDPVELAGCAAGGSEGATRGYGLC
jgi:hypothetical protein